MSDGFSVPTAAILSFAAAGYFLVHGRFGEFLLACAVMWLAVAVVPNPENENGE
jgi:hypothetical protein